MNCGELVSEVLEIVPHKDKEALIRSKLNQMIRYISATGYYWRALKEVTIGTADGVEAAAYIQNIPVDSRFRNLLYCDYPESISTNQIKVLEPEEVVNLKKACISLDNTAYLSSTGIRINNATLTSQFDIGYYEHPANFATDGSEDANSNWITDAVPGLIIDLTAAYILNLIGDNEDSNSITKFVSTLQIAHVQDQVNSAISR